MIKMINKYKFSVIITVHKNFDYIFEALLSVKNQSFKNFEIIIVDTYFCKKRKEIILRKFRQSQIKIKYLKYHNRYLATGARNFAAKKSHGEFLTFLDDDDKYKKNYLSSLYKIIQQKSYDLIITEFSEFNQKKKFSKYSIAKSFNINDVYVYNPAILPSNTAIKKKTFFDINCFNEKFPWSSDKILLIDIINNKYSYRVLKKSLILRRITKSSLTKDLKVTLLNNIKFYNFYKNKFDFITKFRFIKKILIISIKYITKF